MKILFLAGGYDQIVFITELKKRGHCVILLDYNEHPMAEKYADRFFQISTLDIDAVEAVARKEAVDMILTACTDQALLTMAYVSEKLGLPCYLSYQQALDTTNKVYMKKKMINSGIPTSSYTFVDEPKLAEGKHWTFDFSFPVVVKPCDCNSSKGVVKAENPETLCVAIQNAMNLSRDKQVIVEEFQAGRELSVDCWISKGEATIVGISESMKARNTNGFTIIGSHYDPGLIEDVDIKELQGIASEIANEFSLENVPLLLQVIENEQGFHVLEFSPRMGGGTKYRLIAHISGFDIVCNYIDMVLGTRLDNVIVPTFSKQFIEIHYLYVTKGTFSSILGLEDIVDELYLYKPFGTIVNFALTSSDRVAGFLVIADTLSDLREKRKKIKHECMVLDQSGEDIFNRAFLGMCF